MKFFASPRSKQEQAPRTAAPGHDSRAIANIFFSLSDRANYRLTPTQVIKLVYLAHGWTLGHTGKPLISDPVESATWSYGPIVPRLHKTFRRQGMRLLFHAPVVDETGRPYCTKVSSAEDEIINDVYDAYSELTPFQITRAANIADVSWYSNGKDRTISNEKIKRYFQEQLEEARQHAA